MHILQKIRNFNRSRIVHYVSGFHSFFQLAERNVKSRPFKGEIIGLRRSSENDFRKIREKVRVFYEHGTREMSSEKSGFSIPLISLHLLTKTTSG